MPDTMVLNFDQLISTQIKSIQIKNVPGEKTPLLKGSIVVRFNFDYIKKADLMVIVDKYVKQRMYDKMKLFEIDTSSTVMFKNMTTET
jgi:hypothetical protein